MRPAPEWLSEFDRDLHSAPVKGNTPVWLRDSIQWLRRLHVGI
jgi:hypothetical protein